MDIAALSQPFAEISTVKGPQVVFCPGSPKFEIMSLSQPKMILSTAGRHTAWIE